MTEISGIEPVFIPKSPLPCPLSPLISPNPFLLLQIPEITFRVGENDHIVWTLDTMRTIV